MDLVISTTELWDLIGRLSKIDPLTHSSSDTPLGKRLGPDCLSSELGDKNIGDDNDKVSSSGSCGSGGGDDNTASTYSITNYLLHQVEFRTSSHPSHHILDY